MQIGRFNKKIKLLKKTTTINNEAMQVDSWVEEAEVWADIINTKGKEFLDSNRENYSMNRRMYIRYRKELDPSINISATKDYKIQYMNSINDIEYINDIDEGKKYMEIVLKSE